MSSALNATSRGVSQITTDMRVRIGNLPADALRRSALLLNALERFDTPSRRSPTTSIRFASLEEVLKDEIIRMWPCYDMRRHQERDVAAFSAGFDHRSSINSNMTGSTRSVRSVEVINPPITTVANGRCTSDP